MGSLWQLFQILLDLGQGFRGFSKEKRIITFFGGARFHKDHPFSALAHDLALKLSLAGFSVMTGGGGGIMESANRGAFENGGRSLACTIKLPSEKRANRYLHKSLLFRHLFTRKTVLMRFASGFIIFPGGFGTLDELFEILTYMQVSRENRRPVILVGRDYWEPLMEFIRSRLLKEGAISKEDLALIYQSDEAEEIVRILQSGQGLKQ